MSIPLVVTGGFGNGTFSGNIAGVVLRGYSIAAISGGGGKFNAAAFFATGQDDVTITIYDPVDGSLIPTTTDVCTEIGVTGVYVWDSANLTTQPVGYQEYAWKMIDGGVDTEKGGILRMPRHELIDYIKSLEVYGSG